MVSRMDILGTAMDNILKEFGQYELYFRPILLEAFYVVDKDWRFLSFINGKNIPGY